MPSWYDTVSGPFILTETAQSWRTVECGPLRRHPTSSVRNSRAEPNIRRGFLAHGLFKAGIAQCRGRYRPSWRYSCHKAVSASDKALGVPQKCCLILDSTAAAQADWPVCIAAVSWITLKRAGFQRDVSAPRLETGPRILCAHPGMLATGFSFFYAQAPTVHWINRAAAGQDMTTELDERSAP